MCGPHLRGGRYAAPPPFRVKYPNKLFGILLHGEICLFSPFINLFNHLFIIDSWIFILHLGYNSIMLYFVAQIVLTVLLGALLLGSCVPLTRPLPCFKFFVK